MGVHRLYKTERETILLTSEGDNTWDIYTFNTNLKKRLRRYAARHPDLCKLKYEDKEIGCERYIIRKSRVSIRLLPPQNELQRKAAIESGIRNGFGAKTKTGKG